MGGDKLRAFGQAGLQSGRLTWAEEKFPSQDKQARERERDRDSESDANGNLYEFERIHHGVQLTAKALK